MHNIFRNRMKAAVLLALLVTSTVAPAWFTTDANLKMRESLAVDNQKPNVSIFNDSKRRTAAAVIALLAILVNHMAQVVANELTSPTKRSLTLSKKQQAKALLRAIASLANLQVLVWVACSLC